MVRENAEQSARETHPGAVDAHIGARIRLRRSLLKISQDRLANALGLTFQQIQKYERGTNRVSASRLLDISRILQVQVSYFYEDMPSWLTTSPQGLGYGFSEPPERFNTGLDEQLTKRETLELVHAYYQIADPAVRNRVLELVKSLVSSKPNIENS